MQMTMNILVMELGTKKKQNKHIMIVILISMNEIKFEFANVSLCLSKIVKQPIELIVLDKEVKLLNLR